MTDVEYHRSRYDIPKQKGFMGVSYPVLIVCLLIVTIIFDSFFLLRRLDRRLKPTAPRPTAASCRKLRPVQASAAKLSRPCVQRALRPAQWMVWLKVDKRASRFASASATNRRSNQLS